MIAEQAKVALLTMAPWAQGIQSQTGLSLGGLSQPSVAPEGEEQDIPGSCFSLWSLSMTDPPTLQLCRSSPKPCSGTGAVLSSELLPLSTQKITW